MTTNERDFQNFLKTGNMELTGPYGIPVVKGIRMKHPEKLNMLGFNYCTNPNTLYKEKKAVHFFLADTYIERVWAAPDKYLPVFQQYQAIIQPDFSQYTNMPVAMRIWNHYRKMWLSAYYQSHGIRVIPAPGWSDEASYEYCFDGMPKHSLLVISTVGCIQSKGPRKLFMKGLERCLDVLEPSQVVFYGACTDEILDMVPGAVQKQSEQKLRIKSWEGRKYVNSVLPVQTTHHALGSGK